MKAETASILAVFAYLRNSSMYVTGPNKEDDVTEIQGNIYNTRITYTWQDQNDEFFHTVSLTEYDPEIERLVIEVRAGAETTFAELKKEATRQYSISFSDTTSFNSDVVPWFKIDENDTYIHDGYHQNADDNEEGPFTGTVELDGIRTLLNGLYNNKEVRYIVEIVE